jgi:ATP-dependent exoDNAse (exonuclease V) beta subunit
VRVEPSQRPEIAQRAGLLFAPDARDARDLGTAVHQLFQEVSWIDEVDVEGLIAEWSATSSMREDLKQKAVDLFRQAIAAPDIRRVLARPPGNVSLWRERRFEIVIGNRWVSGAFDRVVVLRDQKGKALGATVLDFKSDEVPDDAAVKALAAQYRSQMESYRSALSRMLQIAQTKVALKLVFVHSGRVRDLR